MNKNKDRRYSKVTTNRIFNIWRDMMRRCEDTKRDNYKYYGAKGIKVCSEWHDFKTFVDWVINSGYKKHLTIERIDNKGDYTPKNCTWKSKKEQCNNRITNQYLTVRGETHTITEWAEILKVKPNRLYYRKRSGWTAEEIVDTKKYVNKYR